jgi:hypothetical protein
MLWNLMEVQQYSGGIDYQSCGVSKRPTNGVGQVSRA